MTRSSPRTSIHRFLRVLAWRPGNFARSSGWLLAWMVVRAAALAAIVLLLARQLGAVEYGQFVSVIAVASFASPFIGLGLTHMLLRNGAMDPAHIGTYLAKARWFWLLTILPGIVATALVGWWLLPRGLPYVAAFVAVAMELTASSLTELSARFHQARHQTSLYGAINAGLPIVRLLGLTGLFLAAPHAGAVAVFWTYATCSAAYALALWLPLRLTTPSGTGAEAMPATSGLPFSISGFSTRLQLEFNKPILARSGFGLAGTYNVAQRAVDLVGIPLGALQEALWPRLYAQQDPMPQLRRTGAAMLGLAAACGALIWFVAPLLPWLLGESYKSAVPVMRMLVAIPLLQVLRGLIAFHVIRTGRMALIGWAFIIGAVVNVIVVAMSVPTYGMGGAVAAAYASEITMIATLLVGGMLIRTTRQLDDVH